MAGVVAGSGVTHGAVAATDVQVVHDAADVAEVNDGDDAAHHFVQIAQNALLNGDVRRASTALRDLHDATASGGSLNGAGSQPTVTFPYSSAK